MRKITIMLLTSFLNTFIISIIFFASIIELADMFVYFSQYSENNIAMSEILKIQLLFLPKSIWYCLPIVLLFSGCFTLGNLYMNNELIAILSSGISFKKFVSPIIILSILLSIFQYYFEEEIVITTFKEKKELQSKLLKNTKSSNNNQDIILSDDNFKIIYKIRYYLDEEQSIKDIIIIEKNEDRTGLKRRIDASQGYWDEENKIWVFNNVNIYIYDNDTLEVKSEYLNKFIDPLFNKEPRFFKKITNDIEDKKLNEAREIIENLKMSGLPYKKQLVKYHERMAFSLTPFIVTIIALSIGNKFKKNILLMSLLLSVIIVILYYVVNLIFKTLGSIGTISPMLGAWGGILFFFVISIILLNYAKS